ncbi:TetR/AcrR family transcriptional regulator [Paroceanicella profunda]|uniref:TetR/AcrR family transcriptional regulator n=1 Tax=Paroceanicella profunda TaxID=2579971 RepID=A0A5B8FGG4_9RHOB|nr:TetR/AcrR family transcriptional regulator [Paroceanicella profunda]QDL90838.1 TetR/AcrR family transcriptional regulator [Paroceanicella profunda]
MTDDPPLRADAQQNRDKILAAAEAIFLERGATVSMNEVARHAGVGIGTLYRRFPTREDLLAAAYSARFVAVAEDMRLRAEGADALSTLRAYLEELVRHTTVYRGFAASLGIVLKTGTPGCVATSQVGQQLLQTAQSTGQVRVDITFADLVCVATAVSLAVEQDGIPQSGVAHLVGLFTDGIVVRPPERNRLPGAASG